MATCLKQATKIVEEKIFLYNEILMASCGPRDKSCKDNIAKKRALPFKWWNVNKVKSIEENEVAIKQHMGDEYVVSFFFKEENVSILDLATSIV